MHPHPRRGSPLVGVGTAAVALSPVPTLPGTARRHRTTGTPTSPLRERDRISDRLRRITDRIQRLRGEEAVLAEQVAHLTGVADDAQVRSTVSATPVADREAHAAVRDVANHDRLLRETRDRIRSLEQERDALLERLFALGEDQTHPETRP